MKIFPLLAVVATTMTANSPFAQPTLLRQNSYGGTAYNGLISIKITPDTGLVLSGTSTSNIGLTKSENSLGGYDYWVVKTDKSGNRIWDRTLGGTQVDWGVAALPTPDNGYLMAGYSASCISGTKTKNKHSPVVEDNVSDYYLVKLDATGHQLWDKVIGGEGDDVMDDIKPTKDGGYILAGTSWSDASFEKTEGTYGRRDFWVVKIDSAGNVEWDRDLGGSDDEAGRCIIQTSDGGYLVGGESYSPASGSKTEGNFGSLDCWVVKLDAKGNKQWDRTFGGTEEDQCSALLELPNGTFIMGGSSISGVSGNKTTPNKGIADGWLVQVDRKGNKLRELSVGGNDIDFLTTLTLTPEGDLLVGGASSSGVSGDKSEPAFTPGLNDGWVVKLNRNLEKVWDKTIGGIDVDVLADLCEVSKNNYLLLVSSYSTRSGNRVPVLKGEADGWVVQLRDKPLAIDEKNPIVLSSLNIKKESFAVSPNPATDLIRISNDGAKRRYSLLDGNGRILHTFSVTGSKTMSVRDMPKGIIYIREQESGKTLKVVISR